MNICQSLALLCVFVLTICRVSGQDRFDRIREVLENHKAVQPNLSQQVESSVDDLGIQEFIRVLGAGNNLNLSVSSDVQGTVVTNFANATVADVLVYLCKEYDLEVEVIGSILSFRRYVPPPNNSSIEPPRKPGVTYNDQSDFLSLDLKMDSLPDVVREITSQSFKNVILGPFVKDRKVSVYIQNRPFLGALEKMAFANGLKVTQTRDNFFLIEQLPVEENSPSSKNPRKSGKARGSKTYSGNLSIKLSGERITVSAQDVPIKEIIESVSYDLGISYFMYNQPEDRVTLAVENASYEGLLDYLFSNSGYTYKKDGQVYLFGKRSLESLRTTELVRLENRTVESVAEAIPAELRKDVEIKEFIELNALILTGSYLNIEAIVNFLKTVDRVVPVVMIEVIIAEIEKNASINTGMSAGFNRETPPESTNGQVGGTGLDLAMNSSTINNVLDAIGGFGLINLGNVTPSFYLTIQALENDGVLRTRSTPKLATINGHEANLTVGTTEFYEVPTTNTIASVTPTISQGVSYQTNEANLNVSIKPMVSGDEQVTLEISVEQSTFGGSISPTAPSDKFIQNFSSVIRVKSNDMVVLGGLENNQKSRSTKGIPGLAKVPILNWFFTERSTNNSKSKLSILIKPTVIY